jgi:dipeptide/tripeptide permease
MDDINRQDGLCLLTFAAYGVPNYYNEITSDNDEDTPPTQEESSSIEDRSLSLERILTFAGLFLVCTGTGGIKPCVSAFGADQVVLKEEEDNKNVKKLEDPIIEGSSSTGTNPSNREELIREFFNSFYFCINVGALGSFAIIPIVRANWGFGAAFLIPTLFMMVALFVFASQRHYYKQRKRDDSLPSLYEILQLCVVILKERFYGVDTLQVRRKHAGVLAHGHDSSCTGTK